ncbi:hypothetical protein MUB16_00610 [Priestia sp. OVL9]|nr:hypothetical protein [Priestia sp. OVL9]
MTTEKKIKKVKCRKNSYLCTLGYTDFAPYLQDILLLKSRKLVIAHLENLGQEHRRNILCVSPTKA